MTTVTGSDKRTFPFLQIDSAVVTDFDLTPFEGWLYVVIVSHINHKTGAAFPSLTTLSKETRMSRRKIITCIQSLETKGLLSVTRSKKEDSKEAEVNHYELIDVNHSAPQIEGGSAQGAPQVVHDVHCNQKNTNKMAIVPKEQEQSMPRKPRKANPHFDIVAELAFGVKPGQPAGKQTAQRVGTILAELKESHGGALPSVEIIRAAHTAWCADNPQLTAPSDAAKFDRMVRAHEATPIPPPLTYPTREELDEAREEMFGVAAMQRAAADHAERMRALGRSTS